MSTPARPRTTRRPVLEGVLHEDTEDSKLPVTSTVAGFPFYDLLVTGGAGARDRGEMIAEQAKMLEKVREILSSVLIDDEVVVYCFPAASPHKWLPFLETAWVYMAQRCMLVLTNKRLIYIPTYVDMKPRRNVSCAWWGDVVKCEFEAGFLGATSFGLKLTYRSGRAEVFHRIPFPVFQRLERLLPDFVGVRRNLRSRSGQRASLCFVCAAQVLRTNPVCRHCSARYRTVKRGVVLALLVPGGGYFYAGYPILGSIDAIIETFLITNLISVILTVSVLGSEGLGLASLLLGSALLLEKAMSMRHVKQLMVDLVPVMWPAAQPNPVIPKMKDQLRRGGSAVAVALMIVFVSVALAIQAPVWRMEREFDREMDYLRANWYEVAQESGELEDLEKVVARTKSKLDYFDYVAKTNTHYRNAAPHLPVDELQFWDEDIQAEYKPVFEEYRDSWNRREAIKERVLHRIDEFRSHSANAVRLANDLDQRPLIVAPEDSVKEIGKGMAKLQKELLAEDP